MNTFGYVYGNPINGYDLLGLETVVTPKGPGIVIDPASIPGTKANQHRVDVTIQGINQIRDLREQAINNMLVMGIKMVASMCADDDPSCDEHFTRCLASSLADLPGSVYGGSRCGVCRDQCVRNGGAWPDIAITGSGSVRCDYWKF